MWEKQLRKQRAHIHSRCGTIVFCLFSAPTDVRILRTRGDYLLQSENQRWDFSLKTKRWKMDFNFSDFLHQQRNANYDGKLQNQRIIHPKLFSGRRPTIKNKTNVSREIVTLLFHKLTFTNSAGSQQSLFLWGLRCNIQGLNGSSNCCGPMDQDCFSLRYHTMTQLHGRQYSDYWPYSEYNIIPSNDVYMSCPYNIAFRFLFTC